MGQFLDHDITLTLEAETGEEDCCADSAEEAEECFPIQIPDKDKVFQSCGQTCLDFVRSASFCEGVAPAREQINGITAFVDASNVYGSDEETASLLRTFVGGRLDSEMVGDKETMPTEEDGGLLGGDIRAEENPGLSSLHTLFIREHNRIADEMAALDGSIDDETIYQETRRIVVAEMQNIVYGQYLAAVMGEEAMAEYDLGIGDDRSEYVPWVDPSIKNSFATAAYRFGHSMIQREIMMMKMTGQPRETFQLRDHFFNSEKYYQDEAAGVDELLLGMAGQPAQLSDRFVSEELTNHLFQDDGEDCGSDLVARNIQRGRDHGLPGYNAFRHLCGMEPVCSWKKAPREITSGNWKKLRGLYEHPSDVDLFTAGLAEKPVSGGLTGPTFACIKGRQFRELKEGDRFFFSHQEETQPGGFTGEQFDNLRSRTMRDLLCDNTDIASVPADVFMNEDKKNPAVSCDESRNVLMVNLFV